jgi:hypothetical protein
MVDIQKNRHKIVGPSVWSAFEHLLECADRDGLIAVDLTGYMVGVKFYRDGKYVFAFQSNPQHLNFYIRKPARNRWGPLTERARTGFYVTKEARGEIQLHLRTRQDAENLANWLFKLP